MGWKETAAQERARIAETIPAEWRVQVPDNAGPAVSFVKESNLLTADELQITGMSAAGLVQKLSKGDVTCVAVTTAFCKRAALAHQLVNCNHDFFPEMALARAKELDDYYARNKKPVGPLHGLPISIKDQLRVKGRPTTMGYVGWIGKHDTEPSVLVNLLQRAGAVFYVKTTVPQSLMVCETINHIIGRTVNPRNENWSCGGSSGGEGAMVGLRGGLIGIGTDIGGSIRVPAAFNFLYGIRPSHGRLPYAGIANSMEGQETVHSVCGPICHSIADMRLFMTSVLDGMPWSYDSKVVPLPWRQSEEDAVKAKISSRQLTLGFYKCDGNMAVDSLKKAGHTVIPWEPYKHPFAVDMVGKIYASDGGKDIDDSLKLSGEPAIPNIGDLVNPSLPKVDLNELWDIHLKKWAYQSEYLTAIRNFEEKHGKELDAIIAPITATAAIRHNQFKYYGYASAINLLDFTSVVVPVTFADKSIDRKDDGFKPLTDMDALVQGEYDPEAYHGAPVAIQVIGRRLTEERIMAIAEEVGKLLGNEVAP